MSDVFASSFGVLAHGIEMSSEGGMIVLIIMTYYLLVVMAFYLYVLLIRRKKVKILRGLFVSSLISYVLVLINILYFSFMWHIPKSIENTCFSAAFLPSSPAIFIFWGSEDASGFYMVAFIVDTLIIFGIIRLILYIKKIAFKNRQEVKRV